MQKKFEIRILQADYENVPDGSQPVWKAVHYDQPVIITANSPKDLVELQNRYKLCDQKFEIVREIPCEANNASTIDEKNSTEKSSTSTKVDSIPQKKETTFESKNSTRLSKPKIVTIGDIQIKYDGDKVYQKQWVRLTDDEQKNIRIINDSNNKIVNMTDKHIEMKKWIIVEEDENSSDD